MHWESCPDDDKLGHQQAPAKCRWPPQSMHSYGHPATNSLLSIVRSLVIVHRSPLLFRVLCFLEDIYFHVVSERKLSSLMLLVACIIHAPVWACASLHDVIGGRQSHKRREPHSGPVIRLHILQLCLQYLCNL